jgi:hypothetical protein
MKQIIVGEQSVPVKATGFTTILFKRFTGKDLFGTLTDTSNGAEKINDVLALFYCMNVQTKCSTVGEMLNTVENENSYYEFLNSFESKDLYSEAVLKEVITTWVASTKTVSNSKNV